MKYTPFSFKENFDYDAGWNKFAVQYAELLQDDTVYTLTKEVMYAILGGHIELKKGMNVLDFNCGTGNDFPYFLKHDCTVVGTDYSDGMLNKAHETYRDQVENGKILLLNGAIEDLDSSSFEVNSFDLIYSITGGFSYVDAKTMIAAHEQLGRFLKPGGKLITAHFGRFCLAESFFYLFRLKFKMALVRWKKQRVVNIKDEGYTLQFRTQRDFKTDYQNIQLDSIHPLLFFTPPYQTGFKPSKRRLLLYKKREMRITSRRYLSNFSDQFVVVFSKRECNSIN